MTDQSEYDQDNLEFVRARLLPIDRDILVPESSRASQLLARINGTPSLRVVRRSYWKQAVCSAAALVLVLGGVFLSRLPNQGQLSVSPQMAVQSSAAGAEAAPANEMAADRAPAAANKENSAALSSLLYATDYEAIRQALASVQGEDDYYQTSAYHFDYGDGESGGNDPGTGGGDGMGGGKGGGGEAVDESAALPRSVSSWALPTDAVSVRNSTDPEEADIVKVDGEFIYYLMTPVGAQAQEIQIVEAANLNLLSTITFESDTEVSDLFVQDNRLAVMYQENEFYTLPVYERMQDGNPVQSGYTEVSAVTLEMFDITADGQASSVNKYTQQGDYVSARLIDDSILLVTDSDSLCNARNLAISDEMLVPAVRNEQVSPEITPIEPGSICIPAEISSDRFAVVSSISMSNFTDNTTKAVMGGADQVYASAESLYLAFAAWDNQSVSSLVRFATEGGDLELAAYGTIPGLIQSSLALSEQDDILRVVTENSDSRALYTLDLSLAPVGDVTALPASSGTDAICYLEDVVYLAAGDAFCVVDLSNPAHPAVLGTATLSAPAEYLQPFGNGKTIALGSNSAAEGGVQVSLLDLSDPLRPTVLQSHRLGTTGSYSLALRTHLAALHWETGIGFPITLYQSATSGAAQFDRDGLALFEIQGDELLQLGLLTPGQYATEDALYAAGGNVQRGLRIGDKLYLLSRSAITAYSLDNLEQTAQLTF